MSRTLQITERAEFDLAEIWSYLAEEASEATVDRFVASLHEACQQLLVFPLGCPERRQLAPDLRVLFYGAYSIYYRSDDQAVIVVRVLHGARDLVAIVDQDGSAPERHRI
ncbi:type II toxin-antitoxin system RelE/ParE family toxin [Burkholderia gladioli]|uniref:type II toxin-antitoxin system RelE/ParE family toxin n=1 Tax=Burkholderia gladioli TaxID=28095 RepID=UPI001641CADA